MGLIDECELGFVDRANTIQPAGELAGQAIDLQCEAGMGTDEMIDNSFEFLKEFIILYYEWIEKCNRWYEGQGGGLVQVQVPRWLVKYKKCKSFEWWGRGLNLLEVPQLGRGGGYSVQVCRSITPEVGGFLQ